MMTSWPKKKKELQNHHMDSTIWNDFRFRESDIVIATYAKAGTTWMQQIVSQLIFAGREDIDVWSLSPWLDFRTPPIAEKLAVLKAQTHRRFLKTHLPLDALVFAPSAKYIYIGRDGRDVLWSMHNHHMHASAALYAAVNDTPGRVGPPFPKPDPDIRRYYHRWLDDDGYPWWPFWENVATWWTARDLDNVLFVHFNDLRNDLRGSIERIARFLAIALDDALLATVTGHCTFDYMKANAERHAPRGGLPWEGGAQVFINKGTNGRWREVLTSDEQQKYERLAIEKLGPACARWLAEGGPVEG